MIKNFEGCKVLFTDTDSFCYSIPGEEDVYAKMRGNEWFDFSNFPKDHPNYSENNKMVPGKFKDECPNDPILEFAGLRSKMYAMRTKNGDEKKTANGVSRRVTNWEIKHDDYKRCLIEDEVMYHSMMRIGHTHHQLESIETLKKSPSPYNDKKWINKNGGEFKTYSFGHKNILGKYK